MLNYQRVSRKCPYNWAIFSQNPADPTSCWFLGGQYTLHWFNMLLFCSGSCVCSPSNHMRQVRKWVPGTASTEHTTTIWPSSSFNRPGVMDPNYFIGNSWAWTALNSHVDVLVSVPGTGGSAPSISFCALAGFFCWKVGWAGFGVSINGVVYP